MKLPKVAVFRKSCLPEYEGRYLYVKTFNSKEEAQAWINEQKGKYFCPSNYTIMTQEK